MGGDYYRKLVICVNTSLKMSAGKMASQVGHASEKACRFSFSNYVNHKAWKSTGSAKIVLAAQNSEHLIEIQNQAKKLKLKTSAIRDAGLTEIEKGSFTALAIGPAKKEEIDKITGKLSMVSKWPHKFKSKS